MRSFFPFMWRLYICCEELHFSLRHKAENFLFGELLLIWMRSSFPTVAENSIKSLCGAFTITGIVWSWTKKNHDKKCSFGFFSVEYSFYLRKRKFSLHFYMQSSFWTMPSIRPTVGKIRVSALQTFSSNSGTTSDNLDAGRKNNLASWVTVGLNQNRKLPFEYSVQSLKSPYHVIWDINIAGHPVPVIPKKRQNIKGISVAGTMNCFESWLD